MILNFVNRQRGLVKQIFIMIFQEWKMNRTGKISMIIVLILVGKLLQGTFLTNGVNVSQLHVPVKVKYFNNWIYNFRGGMKYKSNTKLLNADQHGFFMINVLVKDICFVQSICILPGTTQFCYLHLYLLERSNFEELYRLADCRRTFQFYAAVLVILIHNWKE